MEAADARYAALAREHAETKAALQQAVQRPQKAEQRSLLAASEHLPGASIAAAAAAVPAAAAAHVQQRRQRGGLVAAPAPSDGVTRPPVRVVHSCAARCIPQCAPCCLAVPPCYSLSLLLYAGDWR